MADDQLAPEHCANCGEAIPPKARACPACGADERTGWRETSVYDGIDLPETEEGSSDARPATGLDRARNPAIGRVLFIIFMIVLAAIFLLGR